MAPRSPLVESQRQGKIRSDEASTLRCRTTCTPREHGRASARRVHGACDAAGCRLVSGQLRAQRPRACVVGLLHAGGRQHELQWLVCSLRSRARLAVAGDRGRSVRGPLARRSRGGFPVVDHHTPRVSRDRRTPNRPVERRRSCPPARCSRLDCAPAPASGAEHHHRSDHLILPSW